MVAKRKGLGRGLDALINEVPTPHAEESPQSTPQRSVSEPIKALDAPHPAPAVDNAPTEIPVEQIHRNPWQPRQEFQQGPLDELTLSIKEMGLLQPLLVRRKGDVFELIAGERRLTASRAAGLPKVPVIIKEYSDCEALEVALVENLQREDLNIIEEAEGYQSLSSQFGLTQEQIAKRVGKSRTSVTNALRTLKLPDEVREMLFRNMISPGHAKVLLGLEIEEEQHLLAQRVIKDGLSVRALEKIIAKANRPKKKPRAQRPDLPESRLRQLTEKLNQHFGTATTLTPCNTLANGKRTSGRLEIDYYSNEDLERILQLIGIRDD